VKNSRKKKLNTTDIRFYNDEDWIADDATHICGLFRLNIVRKEYKDLKIVYSI
jgi:hypothetical protein